jgi:formylglycine-generating enzyme required for sulfatase activity
MPYSILAAGRGVAGLLALGILVSGCSEPEPEAQAPMDGGIAGAGGARVDAGMADRPAPSCFSDLPDGGAASGAGGGEMAQIPRGTFVLGDRGDRVTVGAFELDVSEVTSLAFGECVSQGACAATFPGGTCTGGQRALEQHPMNCVSLTQALAYCGWLGKRLPTEEEWEWAARGGDRGLKYPWGDQPPSAQLCWNRCEGTCRTRAFPPSAFGLYDLAGNVWEWTSSRSTAAGDTGHPVFRGGGWRNDQASFFRVAARFADHPDDAQSVFIGFRCAR